MMNNGEESGNNHGNNYINNHSNITNITNNGGMERNQWRWLDDGIATQNKNKTSIIY